MLNNNASFFSFARVAVRGAHLFFSPCGSAIAEEFGVTDSGGHPWDLPYPRKSAPPDRLFHSSHSLYHQYPTALTLTLEISDGVPTSFSPSNTHSDMASSSSTHDTADTASSTDDKAGSTHDKAGSAHDLTKHYEYALTDFYPSTTRCIFKSGPIWEVRKGLDEQGIIRQPRPVCCPEIAPVWSATLERIITCLDKADVQFTCINPFGWANEGEKKSLCDFLLLVGVIPDSLSYDLADSTATDVKRILESINLPEVEVAFVEMVPGCQVERLYSVNPRGDLVSDQRKPFSALLGMPIAPLDSLEYEGTGGLYMKIDSATDDIALLTCAHVIHPPKLFPDNKGMRHHNRSQRKEIMVALGTGGYQGAVKDIETQIDLCDREIDVYEEELAGGTLLPDEVTEIEASKQKSIKKRQDLYVLEAEVKHWRSTPEQRTFGHAIHSSPINFCVKGDNDERFGWTEDWGLIQLDPNMINMETFEGNKLYFGMSFLLSTFYFLSSPSFLSIVSLPFPKFCPPFLFSVSSFVMPMVC